MKMKMTLVAGAVALALAGQANAAIVDTNAANGSDLILSVWNATTGVSFVQDLGISSLGLINQTTLLSPVVPSSLTLPAANATLAGLLAGGTSGFQWNVTAANTSTQTWLTTATTTTSAATVASLTDSAVVLGMNNYQTYLSGVNLVAGANTFVQTSGPTSTAYAGQANFGANWSNNAPFITTAAVGSALNFFFVTTNGSGLLGQKAVTQQFNTGTTAMQFNLSSTGALTYGAAVAVAPVPEPGEWLLMLSGLALLGFIATRRKNQGNTMAFA
jgi:hypothetical protein